MPSQEKFDPTFRFQVGERVADKPKMTSINMGQRFGTVTDLILKTQKTRTGTRRRKFIQVKWDHLQQPVEVDQMRLCAAENILRPAASTNAKNWCGVSHSNPSKERYSLDNGLLPRAPHHCPQIPMSLLESRDKISAAASLL